jgi:hypothetical protein
MDFLDSRENNEFVPKLHVALDVACISFTELTSKFCPSAALPTLSKFRLSAPFLIQASKFSPNISSSCSSFSLVVWLQGVMPLLNPRRACIYILYHTVIM